MQVLLKYLHSSSSKIWWRAKVLLMSPNLDETAVQQSPTNRSDIIGPPCYVTKRVFCKASLLLATVIRLRLKNFEFLIFENCSSEHINLTQVKRQFTGEATKKGGQKTRNLMCWAKMYLCGQNTV